MIPRTTWLQHLHGAEERARLVCFPYAGGSLLTFREWPRILPPGTGLYGVQLPGRGARGRERPLESLVEIAERVADALATFDRRPLLLFGHSMGAWIAFEVARVLRRRGLACPDGLIVSGSGAPQLPRRDPPCSALSRDGFVAHLLALEGTPAEVLANRELLDFLLPALRADFTALETYPYRPEEPLACPIAAVGGREDPGLDAAAIDAWRVHTSAGFSLQMVAGRHFFLHDLPGPFCDVLRREIARVTGR